MRGLRVRFLSSAPSLQLRTSFCYLPDLAKVYKGGEDALFIGEHGFGVADGVGGWAESGIDSALFSRSVMHGCASHLQKKPEDRDIPRALLDAAYKRVKENHVLGSSTALVCTLGTTNKLQVVNLGDSGLKQFRLVHGKYECVYESAIQEHYFNCPFQLGISEQSDTPEKAETTELHLEEDDLLLCFTDGFSDNISLEETTRVLQQHIGEKAKGKHVDLKLLCVNLATEAMRHSYSSTKDTPFALRTKGKYHGGKPDDITVLAAQACAK